MSHEAIRVRYGRTFSRQDQLQRSFVNGCNPDVAFLQFHLAASTVKAQMTNEAQMTNVLVEIQQLQTNPRRLIFIVHVFILFDLVGFLSS
jgi:hypothetical protein